MTIPLWGLLGFVAWTQPSQPASFNAPNIVVTEAYDAVHFQALDLKHKLRVYESMYAPFVALTGRHYSGDAWRGFWGSAAAPDEFLSSNQTVRVSTCDRDDCVPGHGGLELRNVAANYLFESSYRFLGSYQILAAENIRV